MPRKVLDGQGVRKFKIFLPPAFTVIDGDALRYAAYGIVFRVQNFDCKPARARMRRMVGYSGVQDAVRVSDDDRIAVSYLTNLEGFY